ncbi:MAG: hypothetical protein Q4A44_04220 [Bacteroidales bacterium]|nr:hypothetical protein [Bacteroidales bacterium]
MKQLLFLLTLLFSVSFVACESEEDRPAPRFQFSTEAPKNTSGDFIVPREGGTCQLFSMNYSNFIFTMFIVDRQQHIQPTIKNEGRFQVSAEWDWGLAKISGNMLAVTLPPNTSGKTRHLTIVLRASGRLDEVTFLQAAE